MTFPTLPSDFHSKFDIVGCYVEHDGKVIILKRQTHKPQGNQYGLPAGKVDIGENLAEAMARELKEETGIEINPDKLSFIKSFPTRYPGYDFMFHVFKVKLLNRPTVHINEREHILYDWVKPEAILTLPDAMEDFGAYTKEVYGLPTSQTL